MRLRSLATATALAVAVVPFLTSSALSADTTVGDASVPTYMDESCGGLTFLESSPAFVVPTNGVITSWRTATAAGSADATRTLKVARTNSDRTSVTVVGGSSPLALPASTAARTISQSVRIPAKTGDLLGFYSTGKDFCGTVTSAADTYFGFVGDVPVGTTVRTEDGFAAEGFRFSVAATLEADADGDGFGDTTQDKCATDATTQGACKDVTAPQTTVVFAKAAKAKIKATKAGQKKKLKKAKVTVAFAASETSTYTCSVDGGAFTACASPFTVKLKKGTHNIAVRATDAAGNVDVTPATTTVKVKKAKAKKS